LRPGADQAFQEFKLVVYYDDTRRHRLVEGTQGDHEAAGRLMRVRPEILAALSWDFGLG
jgi:hypothetical protein